MKNIKQGALLTAIALTLISTAQSFAVEGLALQIQSTNLVLSWPSAGFESFIIQSRQTLDPSTPWTELTNNYPANSTNRTTFTIPGVVLSSAMSGSGSTNYAPPPTPSSATLQSYYPAGTSVTPLDDATIAFLAQRRIYPPYAWDLEQRPPFPWELEARPPYPWEPTASIAVQSNDGPMDGPTSDGPSSGFYRVFLVPDFWYDYSRYTFNDGMEFMPIYLGVDAQLVSSVKLLVDGQDFPYQEYDQQLWDFGTPGHPDQRYTYGIWFHSDRLTNGTHSLQLVTTLELDSTLNENTPHITMTAPPFQTTINNPIIFTQWDNLLVGTNHTFRAQTTVFPATWEIDVFDANGYSVTNATGTTADGNISWTWDFYDSQGNLRDNVETDPYFDPWVTVTPTTGMAQQSNPALSVPPLRTTPIQTMAQQRIPLSAQRQSLLPTTSTKPLALAKQSETQDNGTATQRPAPLSSIDYPYNGGWIVAHQDWGKDNYNVRNAFLQMFFSLANSPGPAGLSCAAVLLKYGNTNEVDMTPDPVQNMIDRNASWDTLRNRLLQPLFRNLYVLAHGSSDRIGGDWELLVNGDSQGATFDPNTYQTANGPIRTEAYLTSGWCQRLKKPTSDFPHPYRFVFLDGCSTATGDWPYPFGMIPATNSIYYYRNDGERPNAFVGWSQECYYAVRRGSRDHGFGDYEQFANFRTSWMFNWMNNSLTHGLDEALGMAQTQSDWLPPYMGQYIRIYGLNGIGFDDYNHRLFSFPPQ